MCSVLTPYYERHSGHMNSLFSRLLVHSAATIMTKLFGPWLDYPMNKSQVVLGDLGDCCTFCPCLNGVTYKWSFIKSVALLMANDDGPHFSYACTFLHCMAYVYYVTFIIYLFIRLVVFRTTGPKPLQKQAVHIVWSRASSFKWVSSPFLKVIQSLPMSSSSSSCQFYRPFYLPFNNPL